MSWLSDDPLELTGGCHCKAIRYTLKIPSRSERPAIPASEDGNPKWAAQGEIPKTTHFPTISLDHCSDCRLTCGGLLQAWIIGPTSWCEFTLEPRKGDSGTSDSALKASGGEVVMPSDDLIEASFIRDYRSSEGVHRIFCGGCGCSLTYYAEGPRKASGGWEVLPELFDISLATLDKVHLELDTLRPSSHGWWSDRTGWIGEMCRKGSEGWIREPQQSQKEKVDSPTERRFSLHVDDIGLDGDGASGSDGEKDSQDLDAAEADNVELAAVQSHTSDKASRSGVGLQRMHSYLDV